MDEYKKPLTPLEKARLAKQQKALERSNSEAETSSPEVEQPEVVEPVTKKITKNPTDKVEAIYSQLEMIEKTNEICQFLLEHYKLQWVFKRWVGDKADERNKAELYRIFEFYWIPRWLEEYPDQMYKQQFNKVSDIDIVCQYYAMNNIKYDRDRFILVTKE